MSFNLYAFIAFNSLVLYRYSAVLKALRTPFAFVSGSEGHRGACATAWRRLQVPAALATARGRDHGAVLRGREQVPRLRDDGLRVVEAGVERLLGPPTQHPDGVQRAHRTSRAFRRLLGDVSGRKRCLGASF